jgi:hypothetical protein
MRTRAQPNPCSPSTAVGPSRHAGDRVALLALASGLEIGVVVFTVDEGLEGCRGDGP